MNFFPIEALHLHRFDGEEVVGRGVDLDSRQQHLGAEIANVGRLKKYGVRFSNQVWPGDTLTAKATVVELREEGGEQVVDLALEPVNQDGKTVVAGSATARFDP